MICAPCPANCKHCSTKDKCEVCNDGMCPDTDDENATVAGCVVGDWCNVVEIPIDDNFCGEGFGLINDNCEPC